MKKRIVALMITAVFALSMTACGSAQEQAEDNSSTGQTEDNGGAAQAEDNGSTNQADPAASGDAQADPESGAGCGRHHRGVQYSI
ncbi:hypothetical protein H6B11_00175 [Mediterraneibacter glycyrrhizinilyticus]|nr:hypothetical protein [Mediterraneibacter glycyrrhizinilyticus]MBM6852597.1 hypothetical protein [Mediterraneibacter glycyrrhizinilyticus]